VAAIHHVDLRSAGAGMPREGIDLPDDTVAAEIDPQSSAIGVLREEKIFLRLIVAAGETAVVQFRQGAAIGIAFAVDEGEVGAGGGVSARRGGDVLEVKRRC